MLSDMSMDELRRYMGKSPKPTDFDLYWAKSLKELEQQSLDYEFVPADFKSDIANCFHLYFTGVGGARIHCKFVQPKKTTENGPGIVMFHGYFNHSGDWFDKLPYAAQGITVLAMDCRGQGGWSEDNLMVKGPTIKGHIVRGIDDPNPDHLYYRSVFLDTVQTARILMLMDNIDEDRIGVYGVSQGGALSVACCALEPRIKLSIPVYPFLSDYKRIYDLDIDNSAYEEISFYFRIHDPNHLREEEIFYKLGYIDIQNLAERIQARVLWVTALADNKCPPSSQFAAFNKIQSEKDILIYPDYGHEYLPNLSDRVFREFLTL